MPATTIKSLILKRDSHEAYRLYRAGLEWDLIEPIVIENREDLKSEYRWQGKLEPFNHQVQNLITFCRRLPVTLLADDVGLGKTISAGLVISELLARGRASKILIVCPKILGQQWKDELASKFDIPSEIVIGQDLVHTEPPESGAIITTYHSAREHLESFPPDRFDMLILDEAHKLRNLFGVPQTPQVALRFRDALRNRQFRYVLMLTATPIQNRLWDLYSLVELLTIARGHQNPFGSPRLFARKFIADDKDQARQLNPEAKEEFRSIVYGYMSRVRRGDAQLNFPVRQVQLHRVEPSAAEKELIATIAEPIEKLNRLVQISILQALASSPEALSAQLNNMAKKGSVPEELAVSVRQIVQNMTTSGKLEGLEALISKLKNENPDRWRLVIFTTRLETQTTIELFLEKHGFKVGIINGQSGLRNQETIEAFKKEPPDIRVIVSTEAGSEGVNLQVANVLVNYDLPWNPMIVEQRIGRVQRLASPHANVAIFNVVLRGTFEEYIVGRLMEKLQMATHAIGDLDSLLESSGMGGSDGGEGVSFDEYIRRLVVSALKSRNYEEDVAKCEASIEAAKQTLIEEAQNINSLLGGMGGAEYIGPHLPDLPRTNKSMDVKAFTKNAYKHFGAQIDVEHDDRILVNDNGTLHRIRFEESEDAETYALYQEGSPGFSKLVSRVIATGIHEVDDLDDNSRQIFEELVRKWISSFGGTVKQIKADEVYRCFKGTALLRVRATVAHDSYERLVEILCTPDNHYKKDGPLGFSAISRIMEKPQDYGINLDRLTEAACSDAGISEFSRFYLERRAQEMSSAGDNPQLKRKLEDDFTPRMEMTLVGLEGKVYRTVMASASYSLDGESNYNNTVTVIPFLRKMSNLPAFATCAETGQNVPKTCLGKCEISGTDVVQHILVKSDISNRMALSKYIVVCSYTGKKVLVDEAGTSDATGKKVALFFLRKSPVSGKLAEPDQFSKCEITNTEALNTEIMTSDFSQKKYRADEQEKSTVSGKTGHKSEFVTCDETRQRIGKSEAEKCELTGVYVRPGILEKCAISNKSVLPSELERCSVSGKRVQKKLLVSSSISNEKMLEEVGIKSSSGDYCTPAEGKACAWSGANCHPSDIRVCTLTGLPMHYRFLSPADGINLETLDAMLKGSNKSAEMTELWPDILPLVSAQKTKGECRITAAVVSPNNVCLAVCSEVRTLLGLRLRRIGVIYSLQNKTLIGRVTPEYKDIAS